MSWQVDIMLLLKFQDIYAVASSLLNLCIHMLCLSTLYGFFNTVSMLSVSTCFVISSNVDLVKSYNDLPPNKICDWYESSSKVKLVKESVYNTYTVFLRRLLESKQGQVNNLSDSGATINLTDASKEECTYGLPSRQMIESDRVAMTGSNNPNPENLTWLTNVTTANSGEVSRCGAMPRFSTSALRSSEPGSLLCPSGFLRPASCIANPSDPAGQTQLYTTQYQANFPSLEGNNISAYYRPSSHLAQTYASTYNPHYIPSLAGSTSVVMPGHQNVHVEPYSYLSNLPSSASSHDQLQLPHSVAFLAVTAPKPTSRQASPSYSLYSITDESKEDKSLKTTMLLHPSLPLSKQDIQSSESARSDYNAKITQVSKTLQSEQSLHSFVLSSAKEKVRTMKGDSLWSSPYRVPVGKEGSLKHRILRPPPSIDIFQPSVSDIANAPLSAPPSSCECRNEIISLKQSRLSTPTLTKHNLVNSSSMQTSDISSISTLSQHHHPVYFMKGSIIQLANGHLKCVEDLKTCDFVESANSSTDLSVDCSTIIRIEEIPASGLAILGFSVGEKQVQITAEAPLEHPFFIWNQGWSSCSPELSMHRYNLSCSKLKVGDVCISLTHKITQNSQASLNITPSSTSNITVANQDSSAKCLSKKSNSQEHSILCKPPQSHSSYVLSQTPNLMHCGESSSPKRKRKRCSSAPDCISS